jgi:hypothetical protein
MPCRLERTQYFGGTCIHNLVWYASVQAMSDMSSMHCSLSLPPASAGFLLGLLSHPEDGDNMFFWIIRLSLTYKALKPKRPYCSQYCHEKQESKINKDMYDMIYNILSSRGSKRAHQNCHSKFVGNDWKGASSSLHFKRNTKPTSKPNDILWSLTQ